MKISLALLVEEWLNDQTTKELYRLYKYLLTLEKTGVYLLPVLFYWLEQDKIDNLLKYLIDKKEFDAVQFSSTFEKYSNEYQGNEETMFYLFLEHINHDPLASCDFYSTLKQIINSKTISFSTKKEIIEGLSNDTILSNMLKIQVAPFSKLLDYEKNIIYKVLARVDTSTLVYAYYDFDINSNVFKTLLSLYSKRASKILKEDFKFVSNVLPKQIKKAQEEISLHLYDVLCEIN